MVFEIMITEGASDDLNSIYEFISDTDSKQKADYVLNHLESEILSLKDLPNRGVYPKELIELGIKEYREIFFKPYRIIYRVVTNSVFIYLVADGRRDMRKVLERRLFKLE